jgi:hypothetical protein
MTACTEPLISSKRERNKAMVRVRNRFVPVGQPFPEDGDLSLAGAEPLVGQWEMGTFRHKQNPAPCCHICCAQIDTRGVVEISGSVGARARFCKDLHLTVAPGDLPAVFRYEFCEAKLCPLTIGYARTEPTHAAKEHVI